MTVFEIARLATAQVTQSCLADGRRQLTELETYQILGHWQIPVAPYRLAATPNEAAEQARQLGGRVAVKIVSPDILHKSDAGCVRLGLATPEDVAGAAAEVLANARYYDPAARVGGLLVQQMAAPGVELIAGGLGDPSFGPVLMVGLGGIFTEVMKDVAFRLAPVSPAQVQEMLEGLKGYPLLTGVRGRPPVDFKALTAVLVNLSQLVESWPQLKELDLNPLIVSEHGVVAVDGLATLIE